MPDILIRGMEMPESCGMCDAQGLKNAIWHFGFGCKGADIDDFSNAPPASCPIEELPEHGDLIELDAKVDCQYYDEEHEEWTVETVTVEQVLHGCLEEMPPVIVPASEEKTR